MTDFIYGYENWQKIYSQSSLEEKRLIWIYIKFSDGKNIYLKDYASWSLVKNFVQTNNLNIDSIGLRYKSHEIIVDTKDADGVYLVRSIKGEFGGSNKHCYTIGLIKNNKAHKTMWVTPELVEESSYIDDLENCFEEAIIYYGTAKTGTI